MKVDDSSSETASFKDVAGNDYDYWQDGSLKKDNNKEITQIDYNYLKLPEQITLTGGRWIRYDYDANGTKLRKTLSTGKVTDYEEDEIYEDGILYQTTHDEGRIANGIFEYNIVDHLGNLRVAFKDSLGIAKAVQYENRGAWGESLEGIGFSKLNKNRYSYSTYENQEDFGINVFDAHARVYDPIVPRFWQMDPLAEISRRFSPYTYANDNPLRFIDPDGMEVIDVAGGVMYKGDDAKNAYIELQKNRPKEEDPKKEKKYEYLGYSKEAKGYIQQVTNPDGSIYQTKYPFPAPGIQPDYTIEAVLIPIFRPLGWAFNALKFKLFAKVVTNAEVENVVAEVVSENLVKIGVVEGDVMIFSSNVGKETVEGITDFAVKDGKLYLTQLHLQGSSAGSVGRETLWNMAKDLGRQYNVKEVIIQGGRRTTGKYKGQVPSPITIKVD